MNEFISQVCNYVLLFFTFSFLGWCMEVILKFIQYHRFINRGFFIGCYCPIYGSGAVLITLAVGALSNFESSYGLTFVLSFFICGIVEYLVSFYMEKKYHARWWDYSKKPMNLNGRVWIGNLLLFGLGGTFIVKLADPFLFRLFGGMDGTVKIVLSCALVLIFATDFCVSHVVMKLIKGSVEKSEADNTEQITKEIRNLLSNKSVLYRRLADAYPDVIYRTDKIKKRMEMINAQSRQFKEDAEKRLDELNRLIAAEKEKRLAGFESATTLRNDIIKLQDEMLSMYEKSAVDEDAMRALKDKTEEKKSKLGKMKRL